MELLGAEYFISHTFQSQRYISIARGRNFIMYALGPETIPFVSGDIYHPIRTCIQM